MENTFHQVVASMERLEQESSLLPRLPVHSAKALIGLFLPSERDLEQGRVIICLMLSFHTLLDFFPIWVNVGVSPGNEKPRRNIQNPVISHAKERTGEKQNWEEETI